MSLYVSRIFKFTWKQGSRVHPPPPLQLKIAGQWTVDKKLDTGQWTKNWTADSGQKIVDKKLNNGQCAKIGHWKVVDSRHWTLDSIENEQKIGQSPADSNWTVKFRSTLCALLLMKNFVYCSIRPTVGCPLSTVHYLLSTVRCPLSTVQFFVQKPSPAHFPRTVDSGQKL